MQDYNAKFKPLGTVTNEKRSFSAIVFRNRSLGTSSGFCVRAISKRLKLSFITHMLNYFMHYFPDSLMKLPATSEISSAK